ncbi:MAG TPA: hypothetical protein VFU43_06750 [Streptosporangiaceae bacterium]|nr:hypothetical protein [Streptosporangiaceae bacterium]
MSADSAAFPAGLHGLPGGNGGRGGAPGGPGGPGDSGDGGADTIEALLARTEELRAGAVDTLEIVAGLEADGLNDEGAGRYGYADVFALADDLYDRTRRRPPHVPPAANPWRAQAWRHLLRGLLFGLPGLCYAIATPVLTRAGTGYLLIVSLLLSWSVSQGVAYLAYLRLGRGDAAAGKRALRCGLVAGVLVLTPVIVVTGGLLDVGGKSTSLAVGQSVYLLAATAALVGGAEPWLLAALLPGTGASVIQLAVGGPVHPLVWVAWAATIAATIGVAVVHTRTTQGGGDGRRAWRALPRAGRDVLAALPYAMFGLLAGGLLTFGTVSTLLKLSNPSRATTVAVLALSLSMGPAEWILFSYRRRVHGLLVTRTSMARFAWAARTVLLVAVALYAAALLALAAVIVAAAAGIGGVLDGDLLAGMAGAAATPWVAGANLGLGCAFFVALLLQSCGRIRPVVVACAAALAAEAGVAVALGPGSAQLAVQFTASTGLCTVLLAYALVVLGRATSYR